MQFRSADKHAIASTVTMSGWYGEKGAIMKGPRPPRRLFASSWRKTFGKVINVIRTSSRSESPFPSCVQQRPYFSRYRCNICFERRNSPGFLLASSAFERFPATGIVPAADFYLFVRRRISRRVSIGEKVWSGERKTWWSDGRNAVRN